jgi:hypothetical protein
MNERIPAAQQGGSRGKKWRRREKSMASFFWGPLSSFNEDWNVFVGGPIGPPENKKKNKFQQGPGTHARHAQARYCFCCHFIFIGGPKSRPREKRVKPVPICKRINRTSSITFSTSTFQTL